MNLFVVSVLDIEFNLLNGTFKPYRKSNNDPIYVHNDPKHPLQVLKELPKAIGKQLSIISSSKWMFGSSKIEYEDPLKTRGYKEGLVYETMSVDKNDQNEKKIKDRIQYYLVQSAIISFCKDQYLGKYFLNYWTSVFQEDTKFISYLIRTRLN